MGERIPWLAQAMISVFVICLSAAVEGAGTLGVFSGSKLLLDTQVEEPPVNNSISSAPLLKSGDSAEIQMFVSGASGRRTLGFDVLFHDVGNVFTDNFLPPSGVDFTGGIVGPYEGLPRAAALMIHGPTIPANGYIGSIVLTAKQDIAEGTTIILKEVFVGDQSTDKDLLDVSEAAIKFTSERFIEAIRGDVDFDGDVDFTDFLAFATNFGKTGPVPTSGVRTVTQTIVVRDTVEVLRTVHETIHDTVNVVQTVVRTVHDTIMVSDGKSGAFDGFYILGGIRLASTSGVTLDLEPPAVNGALAIDEPFVAMSFTTGITSSAVIGVFAPEPILGSSTEFTFTVQTSQNTTTEWLVVYEGDLIGIGTTADDLAVIVVYRKFQKPSTKPALEPSIESLLRRLEELHPGM